MYYIYLELGVVRFRFRPSNESKAALIKHVRERRGGAKKAGKSKEEQEKADEGARKSNERPPKRATGARFGSRL